MPFTPKSFSSLLFLLIINLNAFAFQNNNKIDSLENYLGKVSEGEKVSTLQSLAKAYYFIDFDKSRTYAKESYGIASGKNNSAGMANAQRLIGNSFIFQDSYDSAFVYLNMALSLYVSIGDKEGVGNVKSSFGKIYMTLGNYQKSLDFMHEALNVFDKTDKEYEKGLIKNDIGIVYYRLRKYNRSMDYLREVMDHFKKSDEDINLGGLLNNMGMILTDLKQYESALIHYEQALAEKKKLGKTFSVASTLSNIGQLHHTMENYQEALRYYNKSLELSQEIDRKVGIGRCYNNLGITHTKLKNFKEAENYILLGFNLFNKVGVSNVRDSYLAFNELYLGMGDTVKAYSWFSKYVILNDSIFNEESDKRISNLEMVYEAEKKEKEIEGLNSENKLKDLQIRATKKWLIALGGGLLVIIIISLITIKQKAKLKHAYDFLVHKNLEIINSDKVLTSFEDELENEGKLMVSRDHDQSQNKYIRSSLLDEQKEDLLVGIKSAFDEEKIYLRDDLTLVVLADKLNINKSYISQVINEYFRKNFSTFVNEYRVKEASRILLEKDSENFTIEAIANSVGFKSMSSFNSAFKKFTGITPSYFVNSTKG